MSVEHFKTSVNALSGEQSIEILLYLKERGWSIAYDIAKELHIHPTTAMRYLSKMHTAGMISRRPRRCRTGTTFEYNLSSQKISLYLDLSDKEAYTKNISPAIKMIAKIVDRLQKIGSPIKPEIFESEKEKEIIGLIISKKVQEDEFSASKDREELFKILRRLIEFSEKSLGKTVTRDIVISASRPMPEDMIQFMPDYIQEVMT